MSEYTIEDFISIFAIQEPEVKKQIIALYQTVSRAISISEVKDSQAILFQIRYIIELLGTHSPFIEKERFELNNDIDDEGTIDQLRDYIP